jgi:hypothetical protein
MLKSFSLLDRTWGRGDTIRGRSTMSNRVHQTKTRFVTEH